MSAQEAIGGRQFSTCKACGLPGKSAGTVNVGGAHGMSAPATAMTHTQDADHPFKVAGPSVGRGGQAVGETYANQYRGASDPRGKLRRILTSAGDPPRKR